MLALFPKHFFSSTIDDPTTGSPHLGTTTAKATLGTVTNSTTATFTLAPGLLWRLKEGLTHVRCVRAQERREQRGEIEQAVEDVASVRVLHRPEGQRKLIHFTGAFDERSLSRKRVAFHYAGSHGYPRAVHRSIG